MTKKNLIKYSLIVIYLASIVFSIMNFIENVNDFKNMLSSLESDEKEEGENN